MPALALGDEHPPRRRPADPPAAARGPRSGAARRAPSPRPSPGPGACAAPPAARRPGRAPGSAATSAACAPAARPDAAAAVPAGSAARAAPGSPRRHRGPAGTRTAPTRSTAGAAPSAPTPRRTVADRLQPPRRGRRCTARSRTPSTSAATHPPRRLADHGEEHLQVIGRRHHRVRPRPHRQELQIRSSNATPNRTTRSPAAVPGPHQTRIQPSHAGNLPGPRITPISSITGRCAIVWHHGRTGCERRESGLLEHPNRPARRVLLLGAEKPCATSPPLTQREPPVCCANPGGARHFGTDPAARHRHRRADRWWCPSRATFALAFEGHGTGVPLLPLVRLQAEKSAPISYRNLQQLLEGLASTSRWEVDVPPGRPARHLYRLTGPGRAVAAELAKTAAATKAPASRELRPRWEGV